MSPLASRSLIKLKSYAILYILGQRQLPSFRATGRAAAHIISYRFASWEYAHSLKYKSILIYLSASSPVVWTAFGEARGEIRDSLLLRDSALFFLWVFGFLHCQENIKETIGNLAHSISQLVGHTIYITQERCLVFLRVI